MAVVSLKIGGRYYKFSCGDGQEDYMRNLAESVDEKAEGLLKSIGFMPEGQLLAMVCILLAEEKSKLSKINTQSQSHDLQVQVAHNINELTKRIDVFADDLNTLLTDEPV